MLLLWLCMLAIPTTLAQGDFASLDPEAALIAEDPHFTPYHDKPRKVDADAHYAPRERTVEKFDFDPSEGLTFFVASKSSECFFQDIKLNNDDLSGAYVVSSADSHIDLEVKNPEGVTIFHRLDDAEGEYRIEPKQVGVYQLCFQNSDSDGKLVTHVIHTLKSQHPVEKEHVSLLAKYASHVDVRLGELESELRLQLIRTNRHIKMEKNMNKRVTFYGTLECAVYLIVCFFQVYYIKRLLQSPRKARTWV